MKLTLIKCTHVFRAIQEIENEKTDFSTAHALIMAKRELAPHVDFYGQSEKELVKEYAIPFENGAAISEDGQFRLAADKYVEFAAKKAELDHVEVELNLTTTKLRTVPALKPATLETLMEVFDFSEVSTS